jgi:quinol-cytochrome oxidoreductase complex cytochrome b subunit
LLLIAVFFPAPIAAPIEQVTAISGDARAPWFFLWIQEMLTWGDPFFWGVLIPLLLLVFLALIPYLFTQPHPSELGRWFPKSGRWAQVALSLIFLLVIVLSVVK